MVTVGFNIEGELHNLIILNVFLVFKNMKNYQQKLFSTEGAII